MILNPWDPESYRVSTIDDIFPSLWVVDGGGGYLILQEVANVISENSRLSDGEQSSRELLRSRRLQQYASDGEE